MRTFTVNLLLVCLAVTGCGDRTPSVASANQDSARLSDTPASLPIIGSSCTVQFRRDMLGGATALPISPLTDGINGVQVSVSGKLLKADAEWIVIEYKQSELWIPRANVLLLSVRSRK